ncbi:MAG: ParA family protein [Rhizobacter sp.]|nr:ParA family protein [Rhizobacter sp.]
MLVTVAALKGGVGKTTTAVHLAGYLQQRARTLLIDEEGAGALDWAEAGLLPFDTLLEADAGPVFNEYQHHVIDAGARADPRLLADLARHSDYLLIPTTPDALALNALLKTLRALAGAERYGVLLTITPPAPQRDAEEARSALDGLGVPVLETSIPRAVAYQRAALGGTLVNEVSDRRAAECWAAYEAVGQEVLQRGRKV